VIRLDGSTISLDKTHESHPYAFVGEPPVCCRAPSKVLPS